jgi:hypothetical protein
MSIPEQGAIYHLCTYLVRHDTDPRGVLVDEDMVRPLMRAFAEHVARLRVLYGDREQSVDDRDTEPSGERSVEQLVVDEIRRPGL